MVYILGLGCAKYEDPHSESFDFSRIPSRTKHSTHFLDISSCTFGTIYGIENIGFTYYFNSKSTWYFLQVPSFTSTNSSDFFNDLSNSLHCVSVKCFHWFFITLFKSALSYSASIIIFNRLVEVNTCSD